MTNRTKNLSKIIGHMTVNIFDRPQPTPKSQKSWMGLKAGDYIKNISPICIFEDKAYSTKLRNELLTINHVFIVKETTNMGAIILLNKTSLLFYLEDKDWKTKFARIRKPKDEKTISNKSKRSKKSN